MLQWLANLISRGLARLSRPALLRLGAQLGWLLGHVVRHRRTMALSALHRSLPALSSAETNAAVNGMYRNLATNLIEILRLEGGAQDPGLDLFSIEGEEHITAALARGHGALLLTAHYGSWELLGIFAAQRAYKLFVIVKKFKHAAMDRLWNRLRESYGIRIIYSHNAARPTLRALRENSLIGFLFDQNRPHDLGVFVTFFGQPACTSPGLAILSSQAQAPVIPVFIRRRDDGGHHIRVLPALPPPPDRTPATVLLYTQRYTTILENEIRTRPGEWLWIHSRWKSQPRPGDAIANPEPVPA